MYEYATSNAKQHRLDWEIRRTYMAQLNSTYRTNFNRKQFKSKCNIMKVVQKHDVNSVCMQKYN